MRALRTAALAVTILLAASSARCEPLFAGTDEHHPASVAITLHRADLKRWAAKGEDVQAYCFFHAANVVRVDGRWYAVNGIARTGLGRHWIEDSGKREQLDDGDKAPPPLRQFLYAINDKINDACP